MKGSGKKAFAIAVTLGLLGLPAICTAQTCGAGSSIAIAKTGDLDFGTLGTSPSAGTARINPATGARTVTGGVIDLGGSFASASFAVLLCGAAGPKRFNILLPSGAVTLTGNFGGSMTVDTFTTSPGPNNVSSDTNPPPTPFSVGATLHVGANQRDGSYSGVFTVTVARQ
jgi:uncharacterized protein DUF4402